MRAGLPLLIVPRLRLFYTRTAMTVVTYADRPKLARKRDQAAAITAIVMKCWDGVSKCWGAHASG